MNSDDEIKVAPTTKETPSPSIKNSQHQTETLETGSNQIKGVRTVRLK